MTRLSLINNKFIPNEKSLEKISQNARFYRKELMETIIKLLQSEQHKIKILNIFVFNTVPLYSENHINLFPFKNLILKFWRAQYNDPTLPKAITVFEIAETQLGSKLR